MPSLVKVSMNQPLPDLAQRLLFFCSLLVYGLTGCQGTDCDNSSCPLVAELDPPSPTKTMLRKNADSILSISISGRDLDNLPGLSANLYQKLDGDPAPQNLTLTSMQGGKYQVKVTAAMLAAFKHGDIYLQVSQGVRNADPIVFGLENRDISYNSIPALSVSGTYPVAESLGFVDTKLVALRSGLDGSLRSSTAIRRFAWMQNQLSIADVMTDYFGQNVFAGKSLAAMSGKNVYLLRELPTGLELDRCPVDPMNAMACTTFNPQLPLDTQAFMVSPDGAVGVRADKDGKLSASGLSEMNLAWQPLSPMAASPTVQLAMGDVDGDTKADLVALWQGSGQPMWSVLLGSSDGKFPNSGLAAQLQMAVGTDPVDALAVGDVDQDGHADLVIGQGRKLRVLYNQGDGFVEAFSVTLDPTQSGPKITAIAVGKLDSSIDATKLLDLVVGSNGTPDMMGSGILYLQAFRGQ